MKYWLLLTALTIITGISGCSRVDQNSAQTEKYRFPGEKHLKNIRMLTNGGENAEAYFSFDEKHLPTKPLTVR